MELDRAVARVERAYRLSWLAVPVGLAIFGWGALDLMRGGGDLGKRLDVGLLVGGAVFVYSPLSLRGSLRRTRGGAAGRVARGRVARSIASLFAMLAFNAGFGYLLFGTTGAIVMGVGSVATFGAIVMHARRLVARRNSRP